jgi:hypothetical protein
MSKFLSTPKMQYGIRGMSRHCGGRFARQVAGNVEKCEASTLFRERLEVRLDENLDGFVARIKPRHEWVLRRSRCPMQRRFGVAASAQDHEVVGIGDQASAETSLKAEHPFNSGEVPHPSSDSPR